MDKILTQTNYELIPLDDKTNVRFYTSFDSGSIVAPHWHDAIEVIYLQKGALKITIENNTFELTENQCIVISPYVIHSTLCSRANQAIVFQIPTSFIYKYISNEHSLIFNLKDPAETDVQQGHIDHFKECLQKMQYLADEKTDGSDLLFNSMLYDVLYQLYKNIIQPMISSKHLKHEKNLKILEPVLNYIVNHYNEPISLEEISSIASFEPKYFCRFFKKNMGITFLEYQNEIKLSKIYNEVISTDDKISDILTRHGFTNYKLFRKLFYAHFNATPSEIRKAIKDCD